MKYFTESAFSGGLYIVLKGERLADLEKKFSTTKNLIIYDNKLKTEISEGDAIFIKTYEKSYIVKVTDTVLSIEKALNAPFEEIVKVNKISYFYPFMKLVL